MITVLLSPLELDPPTSVIVADPTVKSLVEGVVTEALLEVDERATYLGLAEDAVVPHLHVVIRGAPAARRVHPIPALPAQLLMFLSARAYATRGMLQIR